MWDKYSDQPKILPKHIKKQLRKGKLKDYIKILLVNIKYFLPLMIKSFFRRAKGKIDNKEFIGLCINLDKGDIQKEFVDELGVKNLLIRVFLGDDVDKYKQFAKNFDGKIVFNIIQTRKHIEDKTLLEKDIKTIFSSLESLSNEFIIGNAINRIKWGFATIYEYLDFYETIFHIRNKYYPNIKLIGPSIIDFEYHYLIPILYSNKNIYFDKISALLYVDRRGSPKNKQYLIFDLDKKIKFLYEIVYNSKLCSNEIYITETNWPISNTAPFAPTSEKECVSLEEYSIFMKDYFEIANNGLIKKVFWHQLIAPGYGLIDNRKGLQKYPSFEVFKKLVNNK